ncbi:MAG: hypothetical protein IJ526_03235 [Lachnospiraceae bacterium]|nr:hypothetical protein [Lachnospiraceae bacterium]
MTPSDKLNLITQLMNELADYEHDRWSRWQNHLFSLCIENENGSMTIPKQYVDRWKRQASTDYDGLTNKEKESDLHEAAAIFKIIKDYDIYG